jgi:hypothetical protein
VQSIVHRGEMSINTIVLKKLFTWCRFILHYCSHPHGTHFENSLALHVREGTEKDGSNTQNLLWTDRYQPQTSQEVSLYVLVAITTIESKFSEVCTSNHVEICFI